MPALYHLTGQVRRLHDMMDEGYIDAETLNDTIDGLVDGEIAEKAESLLGYVSNLGADVTAIQTEINRLQKRKQTLQNRQESLRDYLRSNMEISEIKKITCPLFTITLRKPMTKVQVDNLEIVPSIYVHTTVAADRALIKAALQDGKLVPGASLVTGKAGLMIK